MLYNLMCCIVPIQKVAWYEVFEMRESVPEEDETGMESQQQ